MKINPYQKLLKEIEKDISKTYKKLSSAILKNAPLKTIQNITKELLLLLGELNYLTKKCKEFIKKKFK